ncbi:ExbD/TolR family protein [Sphingomicrobium marinum]|uniref:ExbD/TolR family protein n=1 Tax=Sphingomicrobium marinum TaxID=1227950 RepID=UPI00223F736D|nr:biopolymer transporter ExbD [Sphingomicrobium marinum]
MSDLNTTPLIDVMLVLLIMFIITIPIQTHKVALDLPAGPPPVADLEPLRNALLLDADGQAYWNAKSVSDDELRTLLELTPQLAPDAELHFRPDAEARYARVDEVMAMIRRAGVDKLGFVGNEKYESEF